MVDFTKNTNTLRDNDIKDSTVNQTNIANVETFKSYEMPIPITSLSIIQEVLEGIIDLSMEELEATELDTEPPRLYRRLIVHFDIGSQYCSNNYYQIVEQHKLKGSMSIRGNCFDYTLIKTSRVRSTAPQGRMSQCITKTIKQDSKPLAISLNILN